MLTQTEKNKRLQLLEMIDKTGGKLAPIAQECGCNLSTVYRWVDKFGLWSDVFVARAIARDSSGKSTT